MCAFICLTMIDADLKYLRHSSRRIGPWSRYRWRRNRRKKKLSRFQFREPFHVMQPPINVSCLCCQGNMKDECFRGLFLNVIFHVLSPGLFLVFLPFMLVSQDRLRYTSKCVQTTLPRYHAFPDNKLREYFPM